MAMVCLCHGVGERAVARAIDRGACSVESVGDACRAGTGCGVCRETIADILDARVAVRRPIPSMLAALPGG